MSALVGEADLALTSADVCFFDPKADIRPDGRLRPLCAISLRVTHRPCDPNNPSRNGSRQNLPTLITFL